MPPVVGQSAPDFSLPSTAGPEISLSSFRGNANVLIAFFPAAFAGVCTAELCSFSENLDRFSGSNTQVLPISGDQIASLSLSRLGGKGQPRQDVRSRIAPGNIDTLEIVRTMKRRSRSAGRGPTMILPRRPD